MGNVYCGCGCASVDVLVCACACTYLAKVELSKGERIKTVIDEINVMNVRVRQWVLALRLPFNVEVGDLVMTGCTLNFEGGRSASTAFRTFILSRVVGLATSSQYRIIIPLYSQRKERTQIHKRTRTRLSICICYKT